MRSVMLADQLRDLQAYGQQRTAELGIEPGDVPDACPGVPEERCRVTAGDEPRRARPDCRRL